MCCHPCKLTAVALLLSGGYCLELGLVGPSVCKVVNQKSQQSLPVTTGCGGKVPVDMDPWNWLLPLERESLEWQSRSAMSLWARRNKTVREFLTLNLIRFVHYFLLNLCVRACFSMTSWAGMNCTLFLLPKELVTFRKSLFMIFYFLVWFGLFETTSCFVAQADLELTI